MKTRTICCLMAAFAFLFMAIIIPSITGVALTRVDGIFTAVSAGVWMLLSIICAVSDSVDYEYDIENLKSRIRELECKLNGSTKGEK